jgi:eukaryotic-like serine/threonine-protein kinase
MDDTQPGPGSHPGRIIGGQFRVRRRLGAGGMGVVYLADQIGVERAVAVKLIRKELSRDEDVNLRFQREARAVGRLNHPGIVQIYTLGQTEVGELFLAMEYVDGRPLSALREPGHPLTEARVLPIVAQILEALAVAHADGIVHRDLKPENVMLAASHGRRDVVKILDFGLVRMLGDDAGVITRTGEIAGTPRYMSPEQARGEPLDQRSDIYSLGMIAYELLVGRSPWDAQTPLEHLRFHRTEPVPPPSERAPEIPLDPRTERFVMRCLEKDPGVRYRDGADALAALRGFLDDVTAPPASAVLTDAPTIAAPAPRALWPFVLAFVGLVGAFAAAYFGGMAYLEREAAGPTVVEESGPEDPPAAVEESGPEDPPAVGESGLKGPPTVGESGPEDPPAAADESGPEDPPAAVDESGPEAPPAALDESGPEDPPTVEHVAEAARPEAPDRPPMAIVSWMDPKAAPSPRARESSLREPGPEAPPTVKTDERLFEGPIASSDELSALAFEGIPVPTDAKLLSRQARALSYYTRESREETDARYRAWLKDAEVSIPKSLTAKWNSDPETPLQMLDVKVAPTKPGTFMVTLMVNPGRVPPLKKLESRGLFGEWLPPDCEVMLLTPTTVGYHCPGEVSAVADGYSGRLEGLTGVQQIEQEYQGGGVYHLSANTADGATVSVSVTTIGAQGIVGVTVTIVAAGQW